MCRDFQLLDAFNVIGATFCMLRIIPDNRELFATAPTAAAPRPVVLNHTPVALTLAVIDTHVVADPTQQEVELGGSVDVDAALLGEAI